MVFRSLLQYANATIFVGEASWKNVWATKSVLQLFELVAGLKVNFHKSKLLGANIDLEILGPMANFLNCKVGHFSCSYLGLFIGANTNRLSTWKRLTKWKGKLLSFGGTLVLLKFVLNSIPIYFLSFGVRDLRSFNLALLGKWRWSFLVERDCLWIKVVTSIYGAMTSLNRRGGRRRVSRWWYDLWNRNLLLSSNFGCVRCNQGLDTSCHIFFKCSFAYQVWMLCLEWCGLFTTHQNNFISHFEQFLGLPSCVAKNHYKWTVIWLATIWSIWLARNEAIFANKFTSPKDLVELIKLRSWKWLKAKYFGFYYLFSCWSGQPATCLNLY
uniref:Reverse transcriptase zinc-binding domain-containing protein n=1 Tax=Cajanus cajan TaxID=3821 RepID=A0A151ST99_CAJCA|nr:hypothetical protein KK1_004313 [Cajanus cajan]